MRGKFALFIDGANLYAMTRVLGFDIDYKRLLGYFSHDGFLIRALYYTALLPAEEQSPMRPLVDYLDYNGYTVISKPAKRFTDKDGVVKIKGNMDIDLCLDMFKLVDKVDTMVLITGDGDFRPLVEYVQNQGVRVEVISTRESKPPMIADELRRQADVFTDLVSIRDYISRVNKPNRNSRSEENEIVKEPVVSPSVHRLSFFGSRGRRSSLG